MKIEKIDNYSVQVLTKDIAQKYQQQITNIWNLIPLSAHGIDDILQEESDGKPYLGKWQHSLVLVGS